MKKYLQQYFGDDLLMGIKIVFPLIGMGYMIYLVVVYIPVIIFIETAVTTGIFLAVLCISWLVGLFVNAYLAQRKNKYEIVPEEEAEADPYEPMSEEYKAINSIGRDE